MKKASLQYITVLSVFILVIISCSKSGSNESWQPNLSPVVDVGVDETVFLPDQSATIDAVGFDDETASLDYSWQQVIGPGAVHIDDMHGSKTKVSGLQKGEYVFEVKVTDRGGLFAKDSIKVEVLDRPSKEIMTVVESIYYCPNGGCTYIIEKSNTVWDKLYKVYVQPDSSTTSWTEALPPLASTDRGTKDRFYYSQEFVDNALIKYDIWINAPTNYTLSSLKARIIFR